MAGTKQGSVGRHAAIAAADRVKLLLSVVEGDEFLAEVLHSANRMIVGLDAADGASRSEQAAGRLRVCRDHARRSGLGPNYHAAKRRSQRAARAVAAPRARPQGRG